MTAQRHWILGAADPEMMAIQAVLIGRGETVEHATVDGVRVNPHNAYAAPLSARAITAALSGATVYLVECVESPMGGSASDAVRARCVRVDHHAPGDPGYGRPPAEYLSASSLGQVLQVLGVTPKHHHRLIAAADHCLGAAYRGECPGVDPDELMAWRAQSRAEFQRRPVSDVMADIESASAALREATEIVVGYDHGPITVRDMRRPVPVPELPEAAARLGLGYMAGPLDGRKYTCSGTPEQVAAWIAWAQMQGITGIYGDPARGFAGGYQEAATR